MTSTGTDEPTTARRLTRLVQAVRAVADADPVQIEATARRLGSSRRYLAPIAWVAGMLVLVVRGLKVLVSNYRLLLLELIPAAWVWVTIKDLHHQKLLDGPLRSPSASGAAGVTRDRDHRRSRRAVVQLRLRVRRHP